MTGDGGVEGLGEGAWPLTPDAAGHARQVAGLEARGLDAWPALQSTAFGGWVVRQSGGFTKRANSVNAVVEGASFDGVRQAAERFYAARGLPAVFRLSPLAPPEADAELERAGYLRFDPSQVALADLSCARADESVGWLSSPTDAWLLGTTRAQGIAASQRGLHDAIVRSIRLPCAFASLRVGGKSVAHGLAVLDRGAVGLYDIVVDPAFRRQGHARTLTRALVHWAREQGADFVYLQVREQNPAARRLYAGLGFRDRYGYHYRVPPR